LTKAEVEEIHGLKPSPKSTELPDNFDELPAPQRARIRAQIHNAKMEKARKANKPKRDGKEKEKQKVLDMFGSLSKEDRDELMKMLNE
jgi:hypothetical protein